MDNHQTILQINVDGRPVDIHAQVRGDGPTILFVHGWLASIHIWKDVFDRPPETYRPVAPDLPGFGKTPPHNDERRWSESPSPSRRLMAPCMQVRTQVRQPMQSSGRSTRT